MRKEMVVLVSLVAVVGTGCSLPDRVTLTTAEGERAYADGQNAMISEQRGTLYYAHRQNSEVERTERAKCGALQALFHGCTERPSQKVEVVLPK